MRHNIYARHGLITALWAALVTSALPAFADNASGDHTAWHLTAITQTYLDRRGIDGGVVNIDEVTANNQGGIIRITMNGKGPCAGRSQRFRFTWRFDRDITNIAGKPGDLAFGTTATLEGEKANCIDGNPYWHVGEYGDLLGTVRGGWGIHYFKDPPNTLPGKMTFSIRLINLTKVGAEISFASSWAGDYSFAGLDLRIRYLYEPVSTGSGSVSGNTPVSTGSSSTSGNTTDASGGRAQIAFCTTYANQAVQQNTENLTRRCGFTGDLWNGNPQVHYNYCLKVNTATAQALAQSRASSLAACGRTNSGTTTPAGGISVISGTYGAVCGQREGNVTGHLVRVCNGRQSCDYTVDYQVIGDPAVGCKKDYIGKWKCPDGRVHSASAPPEAGFRSVVHLSCVP